MSDMLSAGETVRLLNEYREVTHKLYQLANDASVNAIQLDELNDLFAERDRLIEGSNQRALDLSAEGAEQLVAEIRQMDAAVSTRMRLLLGATQHKIRGVQEQKRGTNAYQNEYTADAVFFDRKK